MKPSRLPGILLVLVLMVVFYGTVSAQQDEAAVITGRVVNGSSGGGLPSSTTIILRFHTADQWTDVFQTQMSADGSFSFEDLSKQVGDSYFVGVVYQGVPYHSADAILQAGQNSPVTITIYETTNDRSFISVGLGYIGFTPESGTVHVVEDYWVTNSSDRTYVDVKRFDNYSASLGFNLPAEAGNLNVEDPGFGAKGLDIPATNIETYYLLPGDSATEIKYAYDLPDNNNFEFKRSFAIPVNSLQIGMFSSTLGLQGSNLQYLSQSDEVGGHSSLYQFNLLAAGQSVSVSFVPLAALGTDSSNQAASASPSLLSILGGIIILLLSIGMAYWIWNSPVQMKIPVDAQPIVDDLAQLELAHKNKTISDKAYKKNRTELRKKIMNLLE